MHQVLQSTAALLAFQVVVGDAAPTSSSSASAPGPTGTTYPSGFDMTTSWANLSPYKDAGGFGVPKGVPRGCELSQVHVLHRHAQRYPTSWLLDGGVVEDFAEKLKNYSNTHNTTVGQGPLSFLNNWEYLLGEDLLLVSGAATEATSGANIWSNYGRALYRAPAGVASWDSSLNVYPNGTDRPTPIFRTTDQARILESARWWLSGYFGNTGANSSYSQYDLVITHEGQGFNNTLAADASCVDGDLEEGDNSGKEFIPSLTKDALKRLSGSLPADFNLTAYDVVGMFSLCPYEYATYGSSSFCSLFTEQEWRDFQYFVDLQFYGNYGFGSPTGRAQGIGYVLELAARLEGKRIETSDTSINTTIDSNPATFPLHQPLYMDMSHDNIIIGVAAALGLEYFNYGPNGLPGTVDHAVDRTFKLNELTPFGAHLVSEIWTCPQDTSFDVLDETLYKNPDLSSAKDTTDYIRFVLNGAPVPQDGLDGCEDSVHGFCAVPAFLEGVPTLKVKAAYQYACFGNYTSDGQVGDGRPE